MRRSSRRRRITLTAGVLVASLFISGSLADADVVVRNHVLTDNGDDDGFADTQEAVALRITVRNAGELDLTGVVARLWSSDGALACLTDAEIDIGSLLAGDELNRGVLGLSLDGLFVWVGRSGLT